MRRALAGVPVLVAGGLAWTQVGEPPSHGDAAFVVAVAASLLLLPRRPLWWAVAVPTAALVVACGLARDRPDRALSLIVQGAHDAPGIRAPFLPEGQPALAALAWLVCFGLLAALAALVVGGRPLAAGVVGAVTIAVPATLSGRDLVLWGCIAALAALWPGAALRVRSARAAAVAAAALAASLVVVAAAGARGAGSSESHVDWRGWDPLGSGTRIGVGYVWDATYRGVRFPRRPTELLRIESPPQARYWRASTLDVFVDDHWLESLYPILIGPPRRDLPADPLLPPQALASARLVRQTVTVVGLADRRLVGASQPVRVESRDLASVFFLSGGVMLATDPVRVGDTYTIWSYAPRPDPQALVGVPPDYPAATGRYLELGRARMPAFGTPGRASRVEALLREETNPDLTPYAALWREARRLTAGTSSPYLATLAVERWLRSAGGYVYDESPPPPPPGVPPLVDFVVAARAGYCQHFAGAMAVMLRTLGIPTRVAVGFTSGSREGDAWIVTDHQAHAWVEAWFAGVGWLPFDPTPGRGTFATSYSYAADSADAVRALGTGRLLDFSPDPRSPTDPAPAPGRVTSAADRRDPPTWLLGLLVLPCVWVGGAWAWKERRRRARLALADPRARADAIRRELADTLRDHGVDATRSAPLKALLGALERELRIHADGLAEPLAAARYGPPQVAAAAADTAAAELGRVRADIGRGTGRLRTLLAAARPRTLRGR